MSVGRRPFADLLGLEGTAVGVDERGFVQVDERCRTAEAGVWAVGDLVNTPQLAHVAFAEGMLAIRDILGEEPAPLTTTARRGVSTATPNCVEPHRGLGDRSWLRCGVLQASLRRERSAKIVGDTDGIVKVIAEKRPDGTGGRILGVHMVDPWVTEQLGQGYLAVNWEATVDDIAAFIQPHPTMSELFGETVYRSPAVVSTADPRDERNGRRDHAAVGRDRHRRNHHPMVQERVTPSPWTRSWSRPTRSTPRCRRRSLGRHRDPRCRG